LHYPKPRVRPDQDFESTSVGDGFGDSKTRAAYRALSKPKTAVA
jgi:hypothetical protein